MLQVLPTIGLHTTAVEVRSRAAGCLDTLDLSFSTMISNVRSLSTLSIRSKWRARSAGVFLLKEKTLVQKERQKGQAQGAYGVPVHPALRAEGQP